MLAWDCGSGGLVVFIVFVSLLVRLYIECPPRYKLFLAPLFIYITLGVLFVTKRGCVRFLYPVYNWRYLSSGLEFGRLECLLLACLLNACLVCDFVYGNPGVLLGIFFAVRPY